MASSLTESFRRATKRARPVDPSESSPLLPPRRQNNGTPADGGLYETCLSPTDAAAGAAREAGRPDKDDPQYAQVRRPKQRSAPPSSNAAGDHAWDSHHYDNRPPIPAPRLRRRQSQYNTLRACHSAGLTQAELMERSRYVHRGTRGDPAPYDEDLYAPLPVQRVEAEQEDVYGSVQQHKRILANVRMQPWPLAERKQYRLIMQSALDNRVGMLNTVDAVNHNGHKAVSYATDTIAKYATSHGFLSSFIKKIEGHFGTGVASFFVFLRSLFFLNILTMLFSLGFIIIPQIAFGVGNKNFTNDNSGDLLDKLYNSPVLYGYYDNNTELNGGYNLPAAYLTVNLALFLICFFGMAFVMKRRYHFSKRTTYDNVTTPFSLKVFTFWDHGITESQTGKLTSVGIATGFREELREIEEAGRRSNASLGLAIAVRILVNVVVLTLLAGSGYVVYYFVRRDQERTEFNSNRFLALVEQFEIPFILAALKLVGPMLFERLGVLEHYHPRTAFKWTMSRTMVLYLGNLAVLTVTLLMKASREQGCLNQDAGPTLPAPGTASPVNQPRDTCCWESLVGEEIVKIIIIDFGAILLAVLFADVLRHIVVKRNKTIREKIGRGEFQVAVSVLDMVYGQGLVWIGTFFSPILPAFAMAKTFLLFFFYYYTTMFSHAAPKKIFRASRSGNFLLFVLQVTLFLCVLPMLYVLSRLPPSANCGPFRSYDYAYDVILVHFSEPVRNAINIIGTPVVLLPILVLCLSAILYYRLLIASYRNIIKDIRTQQHFKLAEDLALERQEHINSGSSAGPGSSTSSSNANVGAAAAGAMSTAAGSRTSVASYQSQLSDISTQTGVTTVSGPLASRQTSHAPMPPSSNNNTSASRPPSEHSSRTSIIQEPLPRIPPT
eukprot:scpid38997/ scgid0754/ Transmembrane channel-like protein 3